MLSRSPARLPIVALATANPGKIRELRALLRGLPIRVIPLGRAPGRAGGSALAQFYLPQNLPETGATYEDNARSKALAVAGATGLPAIAEDSGIEVDALGGWPGVKSNRFMGPAATSKDRNRRILDLLAAFPMKARTARFRSVAALAMPDGRVETAQGTCEGRIAKSSAGRGGFGYDPIFIPRGLRRTMAQLSRAEKNCISHRGKAVRALIRKASRLLREAAETWAQNPAPRS